MNEYLKMFLIKKTCFISTERFLEHAQIYSTHTLNAARVWRFSSHLQKVQTYYENNLDLREKI